MLNHLGFYLLRRSVQSLNCLSQFHQQLATHSFEDVLLKWYSESKAKKIKQKKVWTNWGIGLGVNLALAIAIAAGQ